jgi:hypothetical protein
MAYSVFWLQLNRPDGIANFRKPLKLQKSS